MQDDYELLQHINNLDTKGWKLDFNQIITPKRGVSPYVLTDEFMKMTIQKLNL